MNGAHGTALTVMAGPLSPEQAPGDKGPAMTVSAVTVGAVTVGAVT